jgi:hypothetical protein
MNAAHVRAEPAIITRSGFMVDLVAIVSHPIVGPGGLGRCRGRGGLGRPDLTPTTLPNPARAMCDGRHKIGASGICYKTVTTKRISRGFSCARTGAPIQVVTTTLQTRSESVGLALRSCRDRCERSEAPHPSLRSQLRQRCATALASVPIPTVLLREAGWGPAGAVAVAGEVEPVGGHGAQCAGGSRMAQHEAATFPNPWPWPAARRGALRIPIPHAITQ